jgi:hypothetical protein
MQIDPLAVLLLLKVSGPDTLESKILRTEDLDQKISKEKSLPTADPSSKPNQQAEVELVI